jgi:hypothetical protein
MKRKTKSLATVAALTITGSASATVLLTDNFNGIATGFGYVSATGYAADQGGALGSVSYTVSASDGYWNAGRGNTNAALSGTPTAFGNGGTYAIAYDNGRFSLNRDFALDANSANQALQISFNASATNFSNSNGYGAFTVGSVQNVLPWESGGKYGFIFQQTLNAQVYDYTGAAQTEFNDSYASYNSDLFTILLSNTAGTGSAFNGNGSVAKFYVGGNLVNTATLGQLGVGDGYLTFATLAGNGGFGYGQANFDNLNVSVIPEPSAALLGGLGMLALLRRRR